MKQYISIYLLIICIVISFLLYHTYNKPIIEGLENIIKREDGKIVKRRKKSKRKQNEPLIESFNPFNGINQLINGFKRMIGFFKMLGSVFTYIGDLFKYLFQFINRVLNNVAEAFKYIPRVFVWVGSYIAGTMKFIVNLPKCYMWYLLEMFGQLLYLPIKTLVWLFSLKSIENTVWGQIEKIDCMVKKSTGYYLIHYSDDIQDRCYSFCPDEFPEFPKLDWSFNPPSLRMSIDF